MLMNMMNSNLTFSFITLLGLFLTGCGTSKTFLIEDTVMEENLLKIQNGDSSLEHAVKQLINQADSVMKTPVRSVMEKSALPPSGNKHDYLSRGTYWWPNPDKPDGLPYIQKDGKVNPETGKIRDFHYMTELNNAIKILGVSYFYTGNELYVADAIKRLRVWFIDSATRMNPNLNHSQVIPGVSDGREQGLIDTRTFVDLIDGVQLMSTSKNFTKADMDAIKGWFSEFLEWMTTSKIGLAAGKLENNIGTAYYMQIMSYALFTDQKYKARSVLAFEVPNLLDKQFEQDGRQPHELSRTNAWSYSTSNLRYWFRIARLAEHLRVDLWNYKTSNGKGIRNGFDWFLPYAIEGQEWTYDQMRKTDFRQSFAIFMRTGLRKFTTSSGVSSRTAANVVLKAAESEPIKADISQRISSPIGVLTEGI